MVDEDSRIRQVLLEKYGLRVRPEMGRYVLSRLREGAGESVAVRAGDARTGVAIRRLLPHAELQAAMDSSSPRV